MSARLDSSGPQSPTLARDDLLSPTTGSHPLPPRPSSNVPSSNAVANEESITESSTKPQQPRTRGGFEVDDDDDSDAESDQQEDGKDEVDVYDPAPVVVADVSTPPREQTPVNRQPQSPIERNGITPDRVQPVDSPAGVSSSHLQSGSDFPSADAEVSAQAAAATQIKPPVSPTPLSSNVNGTLRSSRLPHDTIGILEDRIKEDSRGDPDAYLELIQEYKNRNRQEDVRATYERYLAVFPNDVSCLSICLQRRH
jgi:cleavage stimulation factor subunit 3